MYSKSLIAICLALVSAVQGALASVDEGRVSPDRDPTRPLGQRIAVPVIQKTDSAPELSSVLIGATRRLAVIDGRVMAEGEEAAGVKVWQIKADRVVVSVAGEKPVTLMLDAARVHKEIR